MKFLFLFFISNIAFAQLSQDQINLWKSKVPMKKTAPTAPPIPTPPPRVEPIDPTPPPVVFNETCEKGKCK